MNQILTTYLLRQLSTAFVFSTAAVTFVVLFAQSFRLLSLVIENSSTALIFLKLLGLSAMAVLPLIMPLGLGVAVVFIYNKLAMDSELVVMRAVGMSPLRLIMPTIILAVAVTVLCTILTMWVSPAANRSLVAIQYEARNSYSFLSSRPGTFNDLSNGITFYANKRGHGGALQGILIQDVQDPNKTVTTMASTGQILEKDGQPKMVIFNGRRQEFDRTTGKLSELLFDQYVLDLDALRKTVGKRAPDLRELRWNELVNPSEDLVRAKGPLPRFSAELHSRLATPLLSISYAFVALAAILIGAFNRRGMAKRILAGAGAIIMAQAAFMTMNGLAARDNRLIIVLYIVSVLPAIIGAFLVFEEMFRFPRTKQRAKGART